jgi:3-hydroxyisobutyrate dehydrogenase
MTEQQRVAILGLGAMGSRMASRLIDAGLAVTVWNRTPAVAEALARTGARSAATPQAAALGAEVVISMVYDDEASRSVWLDPDDGALGGMSAGGLGIECSTLSPAHVVRLHEAAAAHGVAFLDAPLAGSRPQAEAGQLIFMVGGAVADVTRAEPVLLAMGSAVHRAGEAGAGSVVKLMVNTLFGSQLGAVSGPSLRTRRRSARARTAGQGSEFRTHPDGVGWRHETV